jgi:hypothetical protein
MESRIDPFTFTANGTLVIVPPASSNPGAASTTGESLLLHETRVDPAF